VCVCVCLFLSVCVYVFGLVRLVFMRSFTKLMFSTFPLDLNFFFFALFSTNCFHPSETREFEKCAFNSSLAFSQLHVQNENALMQFMNYILSKTINEFDLKKCQSEHEFKTDAIYPANRESSRSYEQMIIVIFNKGIFFLKFFNHFLNVTCF